MGLNLVLPGRTYCGFLVLNLREFKGQALVMHKGCLAPRLFIGGGSLAESSLNSKLQS